MATPKHDPAKALGQTNASLGKAGASGEVRPSARDATGTRKSRRTLSSGVVIILLLVAAGTTGRAFLPSFVRAYVNRSLDIHPMYAGKIGDVQIHLWRGAYSIKDVEISKSVGDIPVPLFSASRVDFALDWKALWRGRVVGRVAMDQPQINFVDAPNDDATQTGGGGPWLQIFKDLFPFRINSAVIHDGSVHLRAYQSLKPLDVYISKLEASVDNLGNIHDETNPLVSTVQASGLAMDQSPFELKITLDPFSYRPTFHLAARILGLDVTKINDLARSYGKFDFKRGWLDLILEADAKEGQLTGYIKPLFRNLKVFSITEDLKEDNVLQFFWQALVGGTATVFKNYSRDQFGTLIPFTGDATGARSADILATIGNVLRNAFVRAYLPQLEGAGDRANSLSFQPPEFTDQFLPETTDVHL